MKQTIIVAGLSAASMAFITKLRSFDKESEIIAFSAEKDFPYNRCFLADYLTQDSELKDIELKPKNFFLENNIQVFFDTRIDKIDPKNNQVFAQEKTYTYDYLFLGIGTRPFIPTSFKNIDLAGVFTFHTLEDMNKITKFIDTHNPKSAVVIGAGLNGVEAVSSLAKKGLSVAVIEAQKTILPGQVDHEVAKWVADKARYQGVTILEENKVVSICGDLNRQVSGVKLETGTRIATEMLIIAAGSALNHEILDNIGIQLKNGSVVVNSNMRTSIPNILAGGDICAAPDMITKKLTRSTTWSDAMLQGLCAATTLGSTPRAYPGMVGLRDSYFFGKEFYACGQTNGTLGYQRVVSKATDEDLEILFMQDDLLKGFILIGDVSRVAELKRLYLS